MNRPTSIIVLLVLSIIMMFLLLFPVALFLLSLHFFKIHSWQIAGILLVYVIPVFVAGSFMAGPIKRKIREIDGFLAASKRFSERFQQRALIQLDQPPEMGLIARLLYWICTSIYMLFYFPLLLLQVVLLMRFENVHPPKNHSFSWFILFIAASYSLGYFNHAILGRGLASGLAVVAVTQIFMSLKVHKGSILLFTYKRFQMRLSIIGETALSVATSFACLHYCISRQTPSAYSSVLNIPDSLYFSSVTFATVGYGDIYPRSLAAKGACTAEIWTGILVLIVAVNIISSIWLQKQQPTPPEGTISPTKEPQ